jgi:hypothetical protein
MDEEYREAAVRHLTDADVLAGGKRWGGAAHLVGFAAECAIKHDVADTVSGRGNGPRRHEALSYAALLRLFARACRADARASHRR